MSTNFKKSNNTDGKGKTKSTSSQKDGVKGDPFVSIGSVLEHKGVKYKIEQFLGRGAYAQVFKAEVICQNFKHKNMEDSSHKFYVAIKIVKLSLITSNKAKSMLKTEVKTHSTIDHKNIVKMHTFFIDETFLYMVLEYCNEGSLDKHPRYFQKGSSALKIPSELTYFYAKQIGLQLISGIKHLHEKHIIHRDLKLQNIFIKNNELKIGDFGLCAEILNQRRQTVCGTPNYIAPEVLFDKEKGHSYEVDVWSFGVIIYTLLFGKPPFQEATVDEIYERIKKNDLRYPRAFAELYEKGSFKEKNTVDLFRRIFTNNPNERICIKEIEKHSFFTTSYDGNLSNESNGSNKENMLRSDVKNKIPCSTKEETNKIYEKQKDTKNSIYFDIFTNLSKRNYIERDIYEDHIIMSFPLTEYSCVGYVMLSNAVGLKYLNGDNLTLVKNKLLVNSKEYFQNKIPLKYHKHISILKHFVINFTSLNWKGLNLPDYPPKNMTERNLLQHTCREVSFVKISKMGMYSYGYVFVFSNGLIEFDFSCGTKVVIGERGRVIRSLTEDGTIPFREEDREKIISIMLTRIKSS